VAGPWRGVEVARVARPPRLHRRHQASIDNCSQEKVVITKDDTTVIDGAGDREAIASRIGQIRTLIEDADSDHDRETLRARLGRLAGGVAVMRVGGATETEARERKDRVEGALNATCAAVLEGVVAGGGAALAHAGEAIAALKGANADQDAGVRIVRRAIQEPLRQIAENAGFDASLVVGKVIDNASSSFGFDAQACEYVDMLKAGVIDPTRVMRSALEAAASVAGLLITTEAMVARKAERSHATGDAAAMNSLM
jgi:chaperonin GroEL